MLVVGWNMQEEIEGLDRGETGGWGDYPLDSVFVRNETRSVLEVLRRIDAKRYILDPEFQRDFVWPEDKQSKLIESCIMRIPLPVFYLAEAKDGRIIIVDGLQRITTFHRYVNNHFRLKGLSSSDEGVVKSALEGKRFEDLPVNLQERILDTQLTTYILDAKAPERARLDIFERVNSGVPLTRQQMRNALYSGAATGWLKEVAESSLFRKATGDSLDSKTMRNREAINRFCAFRILGWQSYRGEMDVFLAESLTAMNAMEPEELRALRTEFDGSMRLNRDLFGDHAFRKSLMAEDPDVRRNVLNISLFDVCSVMLATVAKRGQVTTREKRVLHDTFVDLVYDEDFSAAITYSTNSTRSVSTRFTMASEALGI